MFMMPAAQSLPFAEQRQRIFLSRHKFIHFELHRTDGSSQLFKDVIEDALTHLRVDVLK